MAANSGSRQWGSPERTRVWVEPSPKNRAPHRPLRLAAAAAEPQPQAAATRRSTAPVIYYLCRNGQLEHPHFMELPLPSSSQPLLLRDVMERLDALRGKGMAAMYAWSSKRAYKNGYVWQDLAGDDAILPVHGNEYVLKGSELLLPSAASPSMASKATMSRDTSSSSNSSVDRHKTASWSSVDLPEYQAVKKDPSAADAATQTAAAASEEIEISPPPSSASPDTLETLIKSARAAPAKQPPAGQAAAAGPIAGAGGRMRASAMIMQLISCGSIAVKETGGGAASAVGVGVTPARALSDVGGRKVSVEAEEEEVGFPWAVDRDYMSGSILEMRGGAGAGDEGEAALKRSSSYKAERAEEREEEEQMGKCLPRYSQPSRGSWISSRRYDADAASSST